MSTLVFIVFGMLIGIYVVRMFSTAMMLRPWRWNRAVRAVGQRYGATVRAASWLLPPSMSFMYGRAKCSLRYRSRRRRGGGQCSELICSFPDNRLRLDVARIGNSPRLRGLRSVALGNEFDRRFQIVASHPDGARKFLSDGVQWQIEQLARHQGTDQAHVILSGGKLNISKRGFIRETEALDDFVRFGLELLDQATLTRTTGIDFVDEYSPALLEQVNCPICSEEIRRDMVVCVRCKTPHCRDCWEYNGQCAMFACGETRYAITSSTSA